MIDKELVRTKNGFAPQYYNDVKGEFEVVTGLGGKLNVSDTSVVNAINAAFNSEVIDSFEFEGSTQKEYKRGANTISLVNDGNVDVKLSVNGLTFTVKPNEVFNEHLGNFTNVAITNGVGRAIVKGVKR